MGVKYTNDGLIEDLHFTITITHKCNIHCKYCHLINRDKSISLDNIDKIADFFIKNESEIYKYCKNIVFIFFGGEPLLESDKILYFINKLYYLRTKFVIYTNGILLNKKIIDKLSIFSRDRIMFYISMDGEEKFMLKYRLKNKTQLLNIIKGIELIKEYKINFFITKVLLKETSKELFENLYFLHNLGPRKLDFQPVSNFYNYKFSKNEILNILEGLLLFFNYLLKSGYNKNDILNYIGLPKDKRMYNNIFNYYTGFFLDIDNNVYGLLDGLKLFNYYKTFDILEYKSINVGNILCDKDNLLYIIKNYYIFEKDMKKIGHIRFNREYSKEFYFNKILANYLIKLLF
ncbi:MAG: radical SAM protein [Candidatus Gracilibacteria bacterium]|nr:radical SAM protein [Candidatus Gracilibacteria bacterium]